MGGGLAREGDFCGARTGPGARIFCALFLDIAVSVTALRIAQID
jgi:hypothetical protein